MDVQKYRQHVKSIGIMIMDDRTLVSHINPDQAKIKAHVDRPTNTLTQAPWLWPEGDESLVGNWGIKPAQHNSNPQPIDISKGDVTESRNEFAGINSAGYATDIKSDATETVTQTTLTLGASETSLNRSAANQTEIVSQRVIEGGPGQDNLKGTSGADQIYGRDGHDRIFGNGGNDQIWGGNGNDTIYGGNGDDFIYGDSPPDDTGSTPPERGNDKIYGGAGNDVVIGNEGNDDLFGGTGNDFLDGRAGDDEVYGDAGNDSLRGLNGNDDLYGGTGNDILRDGAGADDFWGGSGADIFEYSRDDDIGRDGGTPFPSYGVGNDRIMDFSFEDRDQIGVYLNDETITAVSDNGSSTTITISDGETLKILGLTGKDFDPNLRFDSISEINAISMQYYGYNAFL